MFAQLAIMRQLDSLPSHLNNGFRANVYRFFIIFARTYMRIHALYAPLRFPFRN